MSTPRLDKRTFDDIETTATFLATHYLQDWKGVVDEQDPGRRVIGLFARLMELLIERENRIPEKNFVSFLDLVGVEQFPGSPAKVPVTFLLAKVATVGAQVPLRTQVATTQTESIDAQIFETTTAFFATPARIVKVVNLIPSIEGYAEVVVGDSPPKPERLADKSRVITAFSETAQIQPVPHVLYLASQALFGREESVDITLVFTIASGDPVVLSADNVLWKRFDSESKEWVDLAAVDLAAQPSEVRIRLRDLAGVAKTTVHGREGHFIAGTTHWIVSAASSRLAMAARD